MARVGAQVSLSRYCYPNESIIILINKSCYYHPVKMYYWNVACTSKTVYNEIKIGNVIFIANRDKDEIGIKYCTEQRSIKFSQWRDMWINILYEEKYGQKLRRFVFPRHQPPEIEELKYLAKNIPKGYLFDIFHVILQLINEINASGLLREKLVRFND